jgi:hypothetical protein
MKVEPFITWPTQDLAIRNIRNSIGKNDVGCKKSRDEGASFICCMVFLHQWLFERGSTFMIVSRTEEYVDKPGNPKSLFWKLDFMLSKLPEWMKPVGYERTHMHIYNPEMETTIDGESTTGDVGRGGRTTAMLLDEFAAVKTGYEVMRATRDNTRCRIFNSTYKGASGAFVDLMNMESVLKVELPWWGNPRKAKGLYIGDPNGVVRKLDPKHEYQQGYKYVCDGKKRSPWYDEEEKRGTKQDIATELDMDPFGSDFQYFNIEMLNNHKELYTKPAYSKHEVRDLVKGEWPGGNRERVNLWVHLVNGKPVQDRDYVMGVDVAQGTGATPTCFSVGDVRTGEKIMEYVNAWVDPVEAAQLAVALCRWVGGKSGDCYMVWEANGPGMLFGKNVVTEGFRNFYRKRNENSLDRSESLSPGWFNVGDEKSVILGEYREALIEGKYINRSGIAVDECKQYVYDKTGKIVHSKSNSTIDYSSGRQNHGDMVIADALCWFGMQRFGSGAALVDVKKEVYEAPAWNDGSFAWRRAYGKRLNAKEMW